MILCQCNSFNHLPKDCKSLLSIGGKLCFRCFNCDKIGHVSLNCPGKKARGQQLGAGVLPSQDINLALPTIEINACGRNEALTS